MPSKCKNTECNKYASYNFQGKTGKLYCKIHAEVGMIITKIDSRICIHTEHSDDKKVPRASFNFPDQSKPLYCKTHSENGMVNLNNKNSKKCSGCNLKQPSYGFIDGKATHCSKCATDDMVDVVSNLCTDEKCQKNATYGIIGSKATKCKHHSISGMVDVKNAKCKLCDKQPTFGKRTKATHCWQHKDDDMKDVRHSTELCRECPSRASYSIGDKPTHCTKHKTDGMKDIVSTMCLQ